jgi:hypothetical protein
MTGRCTAGDHRQRRDRPDEDVLVQRGLGAPASAAAPGRLAGATAASQGLERVTKLKSFTGWS